MLTPFTTALISSRKSVRNRSGLGESLATRAINPVTRISQAIIRPFSSSIMHSRCRDLGRARYGRHPIADQPFLIVSADRAKRGARGVHFGAADAYAQ